MQTANGSSQELAGCLEMLEIEVEGIKSWAHAYIVPDAPYHLLLRCPWQKLVKLSKYEDMNDVYITIRDPLKSSNIHTIATSPCLWPHPSLALTATAISTVPQQPMLEMTGCTSLPTSAVDIYSMIKSFGSKTTGCTNLPTSTVDIYNMIKSSTSPIPSLSPKNPQECSIFNMNAFPSKNPQERKTCTKNIPHSLAIPN
jgi:hypothetical protein